MSDTSDSTSPNYFHPSETLNDLISPVLLRGSDNYAEWSTNIRNLLQAKQKLGYIDGSIPKPLTNPDLTMWRRTNTMILIWILRTIDPKLHSTVTCILDSKELWEKLRTQFSSGNGVRMYQLKSEIRACKQEDGQSVQDYFDRLSKMWEELESYKSTRDCTCGAVEKEKEDEKVHQFLMGLDDSCFSSIRFNIIGQNQLPGLNQVYSLVIREEQQHLQAAQSKEHNPKSEPEKQHYVQPRDKHVSCTHCRRKGHEVEECFALHGHPQWWYELQRNKSTNNTRGGRGRRGSSSGKSTDTRGKVNDSQTTITNPSQKIPNLNLDQFNAFLNLRKMQDPYSNIYSRGPSAPGSSSRFPMAQKLEAKGGNGGKEWDDGADYEGISEVYIREGRKGIKAIKFDYVKNGEPQAGPIHGGFGGFTECFDLVYIDDHEYVVSVECYYEEGVIQGLQINTNICSSAIMGNILGTTFTLEVKGKKIIGFHGSSDENLISLGAYFIPLSPANIRNL